MSKAKVLVSDKLSAEGVEVLRAATNLEVDVNTGLSEDALIEIIGQYDALVIRSNTKVTKRVLKAATSLKAVGRAGIGVDNVDLQEASRRGVIVMNTPYGNTVTTAEHALTLLMSLARKIPQATASMRAGKWEKSKFTGRELWDKTLGIIGIGNIGRIVADRAHGLHMNVIASDPTLTADEAKNHGVEKVNLEGLLARADFISIHAPFLKSTHHMIGAAEFKKMKKTALLVNAARGGIVDEAALAEALAAGEIAGAALDVFEKEPLDPKSPLLQLDNCILTPHLGASTHEAQDRVGIQVAEQIVDFLSSGTIKHGVNVPSLDAESTKMLAPNLEVARSLGRLLAQLAGEPREIRLTAAGPLGSVATPLCHEAAAGFFSHRYKKDITPLSSPYEASERGVKLSTVAEKQHPLPLVRVVVTDKSGIHTASARRSRAGGLRLVALEGYELDAILKGHALVIKNEDKPGVIGAIGTILGEHQLNVARLQVGLDEGTSKALSLWNVDAEVTAQVVQAVEALPNVTSVAAIEI